MKKVILALFIGGMAAIGARAMDHTFVFDGEGDVYGLTRQFTIDPNTLEFVKEISFDEAGIDFSLKNTASTGTGFALVNAGSTDAGIIVYSGMKSDTFMSPEITLSVPNGSIKGVKMYMSAGKNNTGLNALNINFNGKEIESVKDGSLYYWQWKDEEGPESVTLSWKNAYYTRYVHSIEVTYIEDLGGKEECGLAFSDSEAEIVLGEESPLPELSNPYDLPLEWASSNENVATVDSEGTVTPVGAGKTIISVSTEGNDNYSAGNARYTLVVIPLAMDIPQMAELAPELYERVKVGFPMTVTFCNGSFAFVIDEEGNAGYIEDLRNQGNTSTTSQTIYKVGNVIPGGWIATNATSYGSIVWQGLPDNVVETVTVTYPEVTSVSIEDVNRVVVLKNVIFTTKTPGSDNKAYGVTPDGTEYEFQNTYNVNQYPASTYDVTCIVRYFKKDSTTYFYLAPISFTESDDSGMKPAGANAAKVKRFDLLGNPAPESYRGIVIELRDGVSFMYINR